MEEEARITWDSKFFWRSGNSNREYIQKSGSDGAANGRTWVSAYALYDASIGARSNLLGHGQLGHGFDSAYLHSPRPDLVMDQGAVAHLGYATKPCASTRLV